MAYHRREIHAFRLELSVNITEFGKLTSRWLGSGDINVAGPVNNYASEPGTVPDLCLVDNKQF